MRKCIPPSIARTPCLPRYLLSFANPLPETMMLRASVSGVSARPTARQTVAAARVASRPVIPRTTRANKLVVRAESTEGSSVDVDKVVKDLQEKWDAVDNKTSVIVYGAGSIVVIWLSATIVNALNSVPLLPKLMELVGLGYSAWFTYRYLLFKSSREELVQDIEEVKKKISGEQ